MIILGIDPGTARMGYSILDIDNSGVAKIVQSDTIITHVDLQMHFRLKHLHKELTSIIKQFSPKVMVIEKLFFNTNAKTAIHVGQARGVAMLAAADKKLDIFEYTALEAKMVLTGYGRSGKKEMQEAVKTSFNLETIIKSDDANDAIAIAVCFIKKDMPAYIGVKV